MSDNINYISYVRIDCSTKISDTVDNRRVKVEMASVAGKKRKGWNC
jgi:hypothetical protein